MYVYIYMCIYIYYTYVYLSFTCITCLIHIHYICITYTTDLDELLSRDAWPWGKWMELGAHPSLKNISSVGICKKKQLNGIQYVKSSKPTREDC